jgi:methionyl-tRNA formyltransferase
VQRILSGTAPRIPQEQLITGTLHEAPKLNPQNCRIDLRREARKVHDHIRGLSPFPGAWCQLVIDGRAPLHFKVLRTRVVADDGDHGAPGSVQVKDGRMFVACGNGQLEALDVQLEGKRRTSAVEMLRGLRFERSIMLQ